MEKDFFTWTQNPTTFPIEMPGHHSWNCSPDMDLYNTRSNWDLSLDQTDPFESALSSIVSSSATPAATAGRGGVLLNGKLGGICSPSEISTHSSSSYIAYPQSSDNSCYSAPMNSPPKLSVSTVDQMMLQFPALTPFGADHGYEERAARFSCFGSRSLDGMISSQLSVNDAEMAYNSSAAVDSEKLQRVASCQLPGSHLDIIHKKFPENMSDSKEESSVSQKVQINDGIGKKRKSIPPLKAKTSKAGVESKNSDSNRRKSDAKNQKQQHKENSKPPEPPKDYIHVRARRGQATDSHSLAERVRREKISERMKFLQDLVPGCNKVSGKAIMLDEIINYLQSLQRQVECLSMKLATVNPRMDSVHMEALLSKEILQSRKTMYPVESSSSASAAAYQSQEPPFCNDSLNNDHHQRNLQLLSINGFCNSASQVSMWEDELHNVVRMGFHVI